VEQSELRRRLAPSSRPLASGAWTAMLVGDELADIRFAGRLVLRAVRAVVRDQDWGTLVPSIRSVEAIDSNGGTHLALDLEFCGRDANYAGCLTVCVSREGVDVAFDGKALEDFQSNRIGLVVLHPTTDAGREVSVISPDGGTVAARFPEVISADQPFMEVAAMKWVDAGTVFTLGFVGDTFETEDQRNWTDASFKTYSTPLSRPFPVGVRAGEAVRQSIRLEASPVDDGGQSPAWAGEPRPRAKAAISELPEGRVPALALGAGEFAGALPPIPGLDAILVELEGPSSGWAATLKGASDEARVHGAGLDVRAVTRTPDRVVTALQGYFGRVRRLAVFDPASHVAEPEPLSELTTALDGTEFCGQLLAGTRAHFAELNRSSGRTSSGADAMTFSITPQMHSTEAAHIIESAPIQRVAAQNALRIGAGRPVHVGPITLRPRFNAVATSKATGHDGGRFGGWEADELQHEPFTAAWTLASIAALTLDGVASVAYFQTDGPTGVLDGQGRLDPAGELLQKLAGLRGASVLAVDASPACDRSLAIYPVRTPDGVHVFAANLSAQARDVEIMLPPNMTEISAELAVIGATVASEASIETRDDRHVILALGPWSTAVVVIPAAKATQLISTSPNIHTPAKPTERTVPWVAN